MAKGFRSHYQRHQKQQEKRRNPLPQQIAGAPGSNKFSLPVFHLPSHLRNLKIFINNAASPMPPAKYAPNKTIAKIAAIKPAGRSALKHCFEYQTKPAIIGQQLEKKALILEPCPTAIIHALACAVSYIPICHYCPAPPQLLTR